MIPGSVNPLLLKSAGGYQVSRSLRLNSADSAYLSRTPAVAGNRKTWTWAGWVKRAALGTEQTLFEASPGTTDTYTLFWFNSSSQLSLVGDEGASPTTIAETTVAVFRDTGAWMHVVLAVDTTQATTSNRIKIYVNGSEQTLTKSITPSQNYDTYINSTNAHRIGYRIGNSAALSAYLADIHLIDGQALTPSSFTEVSATTGQLIPKAYSGGSYGTNGFYLQFADNSSNTAATLGKDTSGNSNNWTPNNLSVTAGAGNDSLVDTPTSFGTDTGVGGSVRGNYCTWNALAVGSASDLAPSNGNLDATGFSVSGNRNKSIVSTFGVSSGKWYWEVSVTSVTSTASCVIGISSKSDPGVLGDWPGANSFGWSYYAANGTKNNSAQLAYGASYTAGDTIGVALDADNGTLTFYKNNTSQGTAYTGLTSGPYYPAIGHGGSLQAFVTSANFGQRAFAYTAPSGFKALCDTNIAEGTITTSGTYTGNGVADGPFVYLNGVPTAMTVGVNAVTFGTHADKLSNGFKLRTTNVLYNQNALSYSYSITTTGAKFKFARAQPNP